MPDIRDVLKGLSIDDRALYMEARNAMRRAYLSAHSKVLPIEKFEIADDQFLDLIDIKLAILYDRAGVFNHMEGALETKDAVEIETEIKADFESAATRMMKATQLDNAKVVWPQNGKSNA